MANKFSLISSAERRFAPVSYFHHLVDPDAERDDPGGGVLGIFIILLSGRITWKQYYCTFLLISISSVLSQTFERGIVSDIDGNVYPTVVIGK